MLDIEGLLRLKKTFVTRALQTKHLLQLVLKGTHHFKGDQTVMCVPHGSSGYI